MILRILFAWKSEQPWHGAFESFRYWSEGLLFHFLKSYRNL